MTVPPAVAASGSLPRRGLDALFDTLFPAGPSTPSASAVGAVDYLLGALDGPYAGLRDHYERLLAALDAAAGGDFAAADPQLGEPALAASILTSRKLGIEQPFLGVVAKELKVKKKALEKLAADAEQIVQKAGTRPELAEGTRPEPVEGTAP